MDGDTRAVSIAAASIIAKVTRDRMVHALHAVHPGYGWCNNKGYGTPEHYAGLERYGVTPHHRRSFGPIRAIIHNILYVEESGDSRPNTLIPQDS